jgi:hypothetical protein
VLPLTLSLASVNIVAVEIVVLIVIIIVVDVNVTVVPIAIAPVAAPSPPSGGTQRNSRAPHQSRPWHVARIGVGIIRIGRRRRSVNDNGIIRGNVNHVRVSWLNYDNLLAALDRLSLHFLLRAGL